MIHALNSSQNELTADDMDYKIALFGGSFDPPHEGHIHVVTSIYNAFCLRKVYIAPTAQNPFKRHLASYPDRLEMTRRAFLDYPYVSILDIESTGEKGSSHYTIDTIRIFLRDHPQYRTRSVFFIFGSDCVQSLPKWKDLETLFSLVKPLCVIRSQERESFDNQVDLLPISERIREEIKQFAFMMPIYPISSTEVRRRLSLGEDIHLDVPCSVCDYIQEHHLYRE